MRTVNIGELRDQLSAHLRYVREGEEVVVCDRNQPIARILPFRQDAPDWQEKNARLVAAGILKMPEKEMDWDEFFAQPTGTVSREVALQALQDSKGDW